MVGRGALRPALGVCNAKRLFCLHAGENVAAENPIKEALLLNQRDRRRDNYGTEDDGRSMTRLILAPGLR
ncbi:hypothetical protein ATY81_09865 [Rhizobium sp. R72]|nr:hypothetical protein ATY81_09865 [Rhizobium sp. R72]OWV95771.1 hypothetical protein ATY80_09865 [Rhizobium sp. R711]